MEHIFQLQEKLSQLSSDIKILPEKTILNIFVQSLNDIKDENYIKLNAIFQNNDTQNIIKTMCILEKISVQTGLLFSYFCQLHSVIDLIYKIVTILNQNTVFILQFLLDLLDQTELVKINWDKLEQILEVKKAEFQNKEFFNKIKNNNQDLTTLLNTIFSQFQHLKFVQFLSKILNEYSDIQNQKIEEILQNIQNASKQYANPQDHNNSINNQSNNDTNNQNISIKKPYLPPIDNKKYKYTLVLDLDETLVHYVDTRKNQKKFKQLQQDSKDKKQEIGYFLVRPFAEDFLIQLSKYYELVIFTAAMQDYADWILNLIDTKKVISYKLYRQHCTSDATTQSLKDLSSLGRDLSKTIIIDNLPQNFKKQPYNGIGIESWFGEEQDQELLHINNFLQKIAIQNVDDVRNSIKQYKIQQKVQEQKLKEIKQKQYFNKQRKQVISQHYNHNQGILGQMVSNKTLNQNNSKLSKKKFSSHHQDINKYNTSNNSVNLSKRYNSPPPLSKQNYL